MLVHFFLGVNYLTDFPFYQLKFKLSEIDVHIPNKYKAYKAYTKWKAAVCVEIWYNLLESHEGR